MGVNNSEGTTLPELTEDTTLAESLERDEQVYDRLAKAAPAYRRLARALMREDTAGRLTLRDIANMAGMDPAEVVLAARGCEPSMPTVARPPKDALVDWDSVAHDGCPVLDARPLLIDGHDPLAAILDFAERLPDGSSFMVAATFHPQPLRRLFEGRGYGSAAQSIAPDHWRVIFRSGASAP
jgi:hypothetical protein